MYHMILSLNKKIEIEENFRKNFLQGVIPRILHPYFRQSVAEALQKANLPQLNLPLLETLSQTLSPEETDES